MVSLRGSLTLAFVRYLGATLNRAAKNLMTFLTHPLNFLCKGNLLEFTLSFQEKS